TDAATTVRLARQERSMNSSLMSTGVPARLSVPFFDRRRPSFAVSLGKLSRRVYTSRGRKGRSGLPAERGLSKMSHRFSAFLASHVKYRHSADWRSRPAAPLHRQAD